MFGDKNKKLIKAIGYGDLEAVRRLVAEGADVNKPSKEGDKPFSYACEEGHIGIVEFLFLNGVTLSTEELINELVCAASCGYKEIVEILIRNGADVNGKDEDGDTALMVAAENGYPELCKFLIEKGANIHEKDEYGTTILMKACECEENEELILYLLEQGADIEAVNEDEEDMIDILINNENKNAIRALVKRLKEKN